VGGERLIEIWTDLIHNDDIITAIIGFDAVSYEVLQVVEVLCRVT
jgi:hypothetical protein